MCLLVKIKFVCVFLHACRKIIWFGDLNYRLNLSYDEARIFISKKEWSSLIEKDQVHIKAPKLINTKLVLKENQNLIYLPLVYDDQRDPLQLVKELRKGRAFDGWSEGRLIFPPTYKYEVNSDKYQGDDTKVVGRRIPAW